MTTTQPSRHGERLRFPAGFLWGVATSAYQIEGAAFEDGRSESIWDRFCATPGKVLNGDNGTIANDHYHRYRQDIELMKQMGLNAYRFSIAWPRIVPGGTGEVNQKGLDFYDRLVDALLEAGIEPYATLYHWDLPQVLQDEGGWANRKTAYAFADYAEAVVKRLGDRIKAWTTHNEPACASFLSYREGVHAPGLTDQKLALRAVHHLLLSHGLAVPRIRQHSSAPVGITLNIYPVHPARPGNPDDEAVARLLDGEANRIFLDPLFSGYYPQDYMATQEPGALPVEPGDMELIAAPLDFLGVNYYNRHVIQADPDSSAGFHYLKPEGIYTAMDWEIYPAGLYELLVRIHRDYGPRKLYVTENGAATDDKVDADGKIRDELRRYYLREHLRAVNRAIADGVPVEGYFAWSLMDNFEWAWGYSRRFGIIYVDFDNQERIIKESGHWYGQMARLNELLED